MPPNTGSGEGMFIFGETVCKIHMWTCPYRWQSNLIHTVCVDRISCKLPSSHSTAALRCISLSFVLMPRRPISLKDYSIILTLQKDSAVSPRISSDMAQKKNYFELVYHDSSLGWSIHGHLVEGTSVKIAFQVVNQSFFWTVLALKSDDVNLIPRFLPHLNILEFLSDGSTHVAAVDSCVGVQEDVFQQKWSGGFIQCPSSLHVAKMSHKCTVNGQHESITKAFTLHWKTS